MKKLMKRLTMIAIVCFVGVVPAQAVDIAHVDLETVQGQDGFIGVIPSAGLSAHLGGQRTTVNAVSTGTGSTFVNTNTNQGDVDQKGVLGPVSGTSHAKDIHQNISVTGGTGGDGLYVTQGRQGLGTVDLSYSTGLDNVVTRGGKVAIGESASAARGGAGGVNMTNQWGNTNIMHGRGDPNNIVIHEANTGVATSNITSVGGPAAARAQSGAGLVYDMRSGQAPNATRMRSELDVSAISGARVQRVGNGAAEGMSNANGNFRIEQHSTAGGKYQDNNINVNFSVDTHKFQ